MTCIVSLHRGVCLMCTTDGALRFVPSFVASSRLLYQLITSSKESNITTLHTRVRVGSLHTALLRTITRCVCDCD